MTLMDLFPEQEFETREIEAKAILSDDIQSWVKTIAGFANAKGGTLYIGVKNGSFELVGFEHDEVDGIVNAFINEANNHLTPYIRPYFRYISYLNRGKMRYIIAADIPESPIKPIISKFNNVPSIWVRLEGRTSPATQEEIYEMVMNSKKVEYDRQILDRKYNPDEFQKLLAMYQERKGRQLQKKDLIGKGLIDSEGNIIQGLYLFADDYPGKDTKLRCAYYPGFSKGSKEISDFKWFEGNILDSLEFIRNFVETWQTTLYRKKDSGREEEFAYSPRTILEASVNAIAHRNYLIDGSQIQVDMFPDRLEITSPGAFYSGASFHQERDLRRIISKRRNEAISAVLVMLGLMEAGGTGYDLISDDYKNVNEGLKPFVTSRGDSYTLILPNRLWKGDLSSDALGRLNLDYPMIENPSRHDRAILECCYFSFKSAKEIADSCQLTPSTYFRKEIENLVEQGYLETKAAGKTTLYVANKTKVILK
ncbi:MAG: putative DNA binding domain-containing protein [Bacilli bacterium]|nr:putative DNA binding domain-containing protein [Bacilli bacterium]